MQLLILFSLFFSFACVSQVKEKPYEEDSSISVYVEKSTNENKPLKTQVLKVVFEDSSSNFTKEQLEELKLLLEKYLDLQLQVFLLPQDKLLKLVILENFDLLFINPLTYAYVQPSIVPILQAQIGGHWYSNSLMVTRQKDGFKRIEDLIGKRVLFGSSSSLHSYLWPMNQIIRKSIEINSFSYYDNQDYTDLEFINQVLSDKIDAAFIKSYSINWRRKIEISDLEKPRDGLDFHNLGAPIPTNLIALNKGIDSSLRVKIRETLLELAKTEVFNSLLKDYGWGQLRIADQETYEEVVNAYYLLASYLERR